MSIQNQQKTRNNGLVCYLFSLQCTKAVMIASDRTVNGLKRKGFQL